MPVQSDEFKAGAEAMRASVRKLLLAHHEAMSVAASEFQSKESFDRWEEKIAVVREFIAEVESFVIDDVSREVTQQKRLDLIDRSITSVSVQLDRDRILDSIEKEINDTRNAGPSLFGYRDGLRAAHVIVRGNLGSEPPGIGSTERLIEAIKRPGMLVFLDGDDPLEGGAHVIPDTPITAPGLDQLMDEPDYANDVMKAATALGFKAGDFVWTEWQHNRGSCDMPSHWELVGINLELTRIFAPDLPEQNAEPR
jgi:hypothetical protein